ncbi:S1 family peptidase [Acidovorax sp. NCPPB 3576]|uniref:S1 family peptidase n=1 Tax=Acidovorax sp. NCPPB 3576 TaxID=2940488 RepID=UPI00234A000F|nr:S1 family peptidase [Acidovorax sp. NCPPB 3576]WCM89099.1 S1 family peptidase [Acidovorax sp. NCPPB 3576]
MTIKKKIMLIALALATNAVYVSAQDFSADTYAKPENFNFTKEQALKAAGLDVYVNEENSKQVQALVKNRPKIQEIAGEFYAGSWIRYDENLKAHQIFATTAPINKLKNSTFDGDVTFVQVKFSYKQLEAMKDKIMSTFAESAQSSNPLVFGVAIDEEKNRLLVRGREENHNIINSRLRLLGIDMDAILLEDQNGPITLMGSLFGGSKIGASNADTTAMLRCTAGFNVIVDGIYPGTITSAHCWHYNTSWNKVYFADGVGKGVEIGEFFADGYPDKMDAIIFGNTNFVHTLFRKIITTPNNAVSVKPVTGLSQNAKICTSGGTNGWRCGTQKQLVSEAFVNGAIFKFSEATFCGSGGDSGGPVVNETNNAIGIYTGAVGNHPNGTCGSVFGGGTVNSFFQPLTQYLARYPNVAIMSE